MRPYYALSVVMLSVVAVGAPASAQQLYKWVDERGVTNYSNHPPADPKTAKNVRPVEDRLSVYSPDPGLTQAIEDNQKNFDRRQRELIGGRALDDVVADDAVSLHGDADATTVDVLSQEQIADQVALDDCQAPPFLEVRH